MWQLGEHLALDSHINGPSAHFLIMCVTCAAHTCQCRQPAHSNLECHMPPAVFSPVLTSVCFKHRSPSGLPPLPPILLLPTPEQAACSLQLSVDTRSLPTQAHNRCFKHRSLSGLPSPPPPPTHPPTTTTPSTLPLHTTAAAPAAAPTAAAPAAASAAVQSAAAVAIWWSTPASLGRPSGACGDRCIVQLHYRISASIIEQAQETANIVSG